MENYDYINPIEDIIDKEEEDRIFKEIGAIDGISEYLRCLLARDMRLHFNSGKESQDTIKGAFHRTEWFLKKLKTLTSK